MQFIHFSALPHIISSTSDQMHLHRWEYYSSLASKLRQGSSLRSLGLSKRSVQRLKLFDEEAFRPSCDNAIRGAGSL